ncbi:peptidoglycan-N-acetlyglucosamine deacetlyase (PgdA) [Vairimorpha necatrix]|uniref:Peptidoglycan-N-acetlyglucosamine deacetlyase (PgdA) n=1 Tax=Vairimorpha necatrix TaxID=6039 RepID=A0AAX4J8M3_9MICR
MHILLYLLKIISVTLPSTCSNAGLIALTFDEGPTSNTENILDLCQEKDILVTFHFTVHMLSSGKYRNVYKRAIEEGHTVGLRTTPTRNYDEMEPDVINSDINKQIEAINKVTGSDIKFARSPVSDGDVNPEIYNTFVQNNIIQTYYNYGYPEDNKTPEDFEFTISTASPQIDSFIVTLYENVDLDELEELIDIGQKNGYEFVNMDQCLGDYEPDPADVQGGRYKKKNGEVCEIFMLPFITLIYYII